MKTPKLIAFLVMTVAPAMVFAASVDNQIEDAAKASYNYRVMLDNQVKAKAKDGVVTLTGTVQDRDQRTLAEDTVRNLPGVLTVDNQIKVDPAIKEHSDGWIALKIRSALVIHANVSATSTNVDVQNGAVLLTGTVDNQAQKELTEAYAKDIEGVKSIRNELVVKSSMAANDSSNRTMGEVIDDASITSQVKYALLSHRGTSALRTNVTTKDGRVNITGEASSAAEKDLVSKFARDVRGVKTVQNNMTVRQ